MRGKTRLTWDKQRSTSDTCRAHDRPSLARVRPKFGPSSRQCKARDRPNRGHPGGTPDLGGTATAYLEGSQQRLCAQMAMLRTHALPTHARANLPEDDHNAASNRCNAKRPTVLLMGRTRWHWSPQSAKSLCGPCADAWRTSLTPLALPCRRPRSPGAPRRPVSRNAWAPLSTPDLNYTSRGPAPMRAETCAEITDGLRVEPKLGLTYGDTSAIQSGGACRFRTSLLSSCCGPAMAAATGGEEGGAAA